ncbi:PQQ-dependent sugar dehydrogenase [Lentzea sp. NPDC006480]|uniref:PQQ-dependent sugar dehydrogenase n=1 Tax=Lentzea sp. NPDC006480 TaxID=3157176 RepID=UPI0033B6CDDE
MVRSIALLTAACLLAGGCASFPDEPAPTSWSAQPQLTPQAGPKPELPGEFRPAPGEQGKGQTPQSVPPPQGCKDFNPAVIATCLNTVTGVAPIGADAQGGVAAYATERGGRLVKVTKDVDPVVIAQIEVDASADGGLTGLALSATFAEDQLAYVYVTTATDNRVLRIAPGDTPKPILTGIPKGPSGNRGVLASDRRGGILVATGDAGNPALAADPNSLAGKVLRIDGSGKPAQGNPTAGSPVITSGLRQPGGLCVSADAQKIWVTDWSANFDAVYHVVPGKLGDAAWTWPDRPGVMGCASLTDLLWVATAKTPGLQNLPMNSVGAFTGKPTLTMDDAGGYGRIGPIEALNDSSALIGTINKVGGQPVSSDDRVAIMVRTGQNAGKD